ncbi:hypothetical protein SCLCIDRAFT_1207531 [Scleroderma citrinum Foug A]|uniref:Uncharacterized protein n=1 Tax=Scleroderma citrinum Foug A TaxID=1036808 RepID=A0A0C3AZ14_9AGAM|nr:hypothetical protein SCLCIDRAFT_1207531 [Scleroderma citrinum Foug A]
MLQPDHQLQPSGITSFPPMVPPNVTSSILTSFVAHSAHLQNQLATMNIHGKDASLLLQVGINSVRKSP